MSNSDGSSGAGSLVPRAKCQAMTPPRDPIEAVTHVDPYPYYEELSQRPMYHDSRLGLWVVASAGAVSAILEDDRFVVRPPAEPVPQALLGSRAADVFRLLVRMNEGPGHGPFKRAIGVALASLRHDTVAATSRAVALALVADLTRDGRMDLDAFAFRMPVHVVGSLLGLPSARLAELAPSIDALVRGFGPGASPAQIQDAGDAADILLRVFHAARSDAPSDGLLARLGREAAASDGADVVVANAIGFLTQSYEATAGLIGNGIVALVRDPVARRRLATDPGTVRDFVLKVLRSDPPVQNTRRWVTRSGVLAGRELAAGECLLLVLASANHDPAADGAFAFGAGRHACPGHAVAVMVAEAALHELLAADCIPHRWEVAYRPSLNVRIPRFEAAAPA